MELLTKIVLVAECGGFADDTDELEVTPSAIDRTKLAAKAADKLLLGVAHFAFIKKDGSLREAFGTNKPSLLPPITAAEEADNKKKAANPDLQVYYDLEAGAYRSFSVSRIVALF